MKSILYEKYDITVNYLGQDSFEFIYPDEKILKIEKNNDSEERIISGSRINNEEFSINFKNSIIDFENMEILETNGSKVSYEDFILRISPNSQTAKPCSQYPSGVTFSSCFQTEMSEFCDGVIGCIAILVVPRELAVAFTIHCTRCVAQNSENPDTGLE